MGRPRPYSAPRLRSGPGTAVQAPLLMQRAVSSALTMLDPNIKLFTSMNCLSFTSGFAMGPRAEGGADVLLGCALGASGRGILGPAAEARVTAGVLVCASTGATIANRQAINSSNCVRLGFMFRSWSESKRWLSPLSVD